MDKKYLFIGGGVIIVFLILFAGYYLYQKYFLVYGHARLGALAGAKVLIYELSEKGKPKLKWQDTTSDGSRLEDIGKFDLHLQSIDANKYYLFKVKGGKDWDANNDGRKDKRFTRNYGTLMAIAKGSDLLAVRGNFNVTIVTTLLSLDTQKIWNKKFDSKQLEQTLKKLLPSIIKDIDEDGKVTIQDALIFDPVVDRESLTKIYKRKFKKFVNYVHLGKSNLSPIIASLDTPGNAGRITISPDGTKAYVADWDAGVEIVDISNPKHLRLLGHFETPSDAEAVALSKNGKIAYVANGDAGLLVVNVKNPAHPQVLGKVATVAWARDVILAKKKGLVYVADAYAGVQVIDVSNLRSPKIIATVDTPVEARRLALSHDGKLLFVADSYGGIQVIDVTVDKAPLIISHFKTLNIARGLVLSDDGTKLYVADTEAGLEIIDVSDPINMVRLGNIDTPGNAADVTLSFDGRRAYIADTEGGLEAFDVSSSTNPKLIGEFHSSDIVLGVTFFNGRLFVAAADNGLEIIDPGFFED